MPDNITSALQQLLYGAPVPYKFFGDASLYDINDTLSLLYLSAVECKSKVKSYLLKNDGAAIESAYAKAFKVLRTVLYLYDTMQKEDLVQVLKDNVGIQDGLSWEEVLQFSQQRQLIEVKDVGPSLLKVSISELGKQFMSDDEVIVFLRSLHLDE